MLTIKNLVDGTLVPSVSLSIFFTVGSLLFVAVFNRYAHGLRRYDGPFVASLTHFWRVRDSYINGNKRPTIVQLHQEYGDVVRTGPNTLSFASPNAIADIYGSASRMQKSRWYVAFEAHGKGPAKANIFSTRDIHWHARYRALVESGFRLDHLSGQEPHIDNLIQSLLKNLDNAATDGAGPQSIDLPFVLQQFTFDAGGVFAFSRPYGFLKQKIDLDGIIWSVRTGSMHLCRLSQAPLLQIFFDKNPLAVYFGFIAPPMAFAKKYLPTQRIETQLSCEAPKTPTNPDILDQYLAAHRSNPGVVTLNEIVDLGLMVVVPASEAVRTAISVCIFHLCKHPDKMAKLRLELDKAMPDASVIPSWHVVSKLQYLDACIKEAWRIHPSTGFMKERVVPPGRAIIDGHAVPAGSHVHCSEWIIHRHKPIYGDDVEIFRPERWIEADPNRREQMERYFCPFGFETRLCLGKDIALFEVYKVVAVLIRIYEILLAKPDEDMSITWGNIVSVDYRAFLSRRP